MDLIDRQPEERTETHACDSISRRAALKIVAKHIGVDGDRACLIDVGKTYGEIYALPSAQPEQRWIPCSERLPDIDADGYTDKVLVSFDHYSGVEICEYRITDGVGRWYAGDTDDSPEDIDLQVTAWMPLPKRYEGGDT